MSLLSRSAERRSEYRTDAGIAPVRGKRFSLPAQSLSHNHCGGVGHPPSGLPDRGGERPPSQKITSTYPRSPIRAYPSRVLSGGNASGNLRKSGKDRRFGFTGRKTCAAGEVWLNGCALGKALKNAGAGGPQDRKHSIPEHPRPAFQGPPVFPTFQQPDATADVATGKPYRRIPGRLLPSSGTPLNLCRSRKGMRCGLKVQRPMWPTRI